MLASVAGAVGGLGRREPTVCRRIAHTSDGVTDAGVVCVVQYAGRYDCTVVGAANPAAARQYALRM